MNNEICRHQIEELLFNAHLEREVDLIDEYFATSSSLDRATDMLKGFSKTLQI